jgi:ergosteryl-3beta-O-L-aspartate synthase
MSVIRKLSKAIHDFPIGERGSSADTSPVASPRISCSSPHRRSIATVFHEKEYVSSSDDFSSSDYEGGLSKNAQKRQTRKLQRESRSRLSIERKDESEERTKNKLDEASKHETEAMKNRYGQLPLMQSTERSGDSRVNLEDITPNMVGQEIVFRARIHHVRRMGSKLVFFIFRQQINTIQGVLNELPGLTSLVMLHWAEHLQRGSIVKISGVLQKPEVPVKSTTWHDLEVKVNEMKLIVRRADPSKSTHAFCTRTIF